MIYLTRLSHILRCTHVKQWVTKPVAVRIRYQVTLVEASYDTFGSGSDKIVLPIKGLLQCHNKPKTKKNNIVEMTMLLSKSGIKWHC